MTNILSVTAPIYLGIGVGFFASKAGFFTKSDSQTLGKFVMNFALPAMLFSALASKNFADVWHPAYLAAYAAGSLLAFFLMWVFCRFVANIPASQSALMGIGASCSNSGYIGYPILLQLLGPTAGVGLAMTLLVENIVMIPLGLSMAEGGQSTHHNWRRLILDSFQRLSRVPMIWAIITGLIFSVFGLHLPGILDKTVGLFSAACAATALFVNGTNLVGLQTRGLGKTISGIALTKLVIHPLSVALFLWVLGPVETPLQISGVILAAMPMMGIYPIVGQRFNLSGLCSAALLLTTTASFFSISVILWGMSVFEPWHAILH